MSYENFCDLVQRKRPIDISAGTFLLSLLKNLESDDKSVDLDFYVDFRNPTEFQDVVNDILFYFGFPSLNPECSSFDSLILDVYSEVLSEKQYSSNAHFQEIYITKLRDYFRQIAHIQ